MKFYYYILLLLPLFGMAQIKIKNQPSSDWYETTWKMHQQKKIKGDSLLKMKPTAFPDGFQDTLRKYDWVDLGGYLYVDKHFSVWYDTERPMQYDVFRFADGDTIINFSYNTGNNYITHTNFKDTYWMLPTYTFKKIGTANVIELCYQKTSKEIIKLISYKNGVLIYDIPMNGKLTDKKMFRRCAYMARKKEFTWSKSENK